jgi:hypothetical protein
LGSTGRLLDFLLFVLLVQRDVFLDRQGGVLMRLQCTMGDVGLLRRRLEVAVRRMLGGAPVMLGGLLEVLGSGLEELLKVLDGNAPDIVWRRCNVTAVTSPWRLPPKRCPVVTISGCLSRW